MEQFNIYKDGTKVSTTDDTSFLFDGLETGVEYELGVSRVAGFYQLNVIKYITRYKNKNGVEDLQKAES